MQILCLVARLLLIYSLAFSLVKLAFFVYERRVKDRGRESAVLFVGLLPEVCRCFVWLVPVFAKL